MLAGVLGDPGFTCVSLIRRLGFAFGHPLCVGLPLFPLGSLVSSVWVIVGLGVKGGRGIGFRVERVRGEKVFGFEW